MSIQKAQAGKSAKTLDVEVYYTSYGRMTRRAFMELAKQEGMYTDIKKVRMEDKEAKEREWLSKNAFSHPFGNLNHPQTIAYNKRKEALKAGLFKDEYQLRKPDSHSFYVISKTEYDYFNSL